MTAREKIEEAAKEFAIQAYDDADYDIILKRVADFNKNFEPQTLFGNEM